MYDTTSQSYFARSQQAPRGPQTEAAPDAAGAQNAGTLRISDWKYGKQWVYSITYDEALQELHRFAVPIHDEFGIPGHMEAVAGHIGKVRQLGQSSYNGYHHMSGPE